MQYRDDLVKFNADFTKIGSGVVDKCSEYMQKRIYLRAIRPYNFQTTLMSVSTQMSLQETMATAIELEPRYRGRTGNQEGNSSSNQPSKGGFEKRRRRIECQKCNKWHYEDERCNTANKPGSRPDHRSKNPRVNEGEMERIPEE
jgi:hypothetical protein